MAYPPAPWILEGFALMTLNFINSDKARALIPPELKVVNVLPNKTLGGVYLACYSSSPVQNYNELIIIAGLVRYSNQFGFWISHIYVDNPDSVAGGRGIWGLPKELAQFTWDKSKDSRVIVRQSDRTLCSLKYPQPLSLWKQSLSGPTFSTLNSNLLLFNGEAKFRVGITSGSLEIPTESPFHLLNISKPILTPYLKDLRLLAGVPEIVTKINNSVHV